MSPSHDELSELDELVGWYTLTQHISWLIIHADWMLSNFSRIDVVWQK